MRIAFDTIEPTRGDNETTPVLLRAAMAIAPQWETLDYQRPAEIRDDTSDHPFPRRAARFDRWSQVQLPWAAWRDRVDVIVTTQLNIPALRPCPVVACINHLDPIEAPRGRTVAEVITFERRVRAACRRATRIICPTEHLRSRLIAEFGASEDQVDVVTPGRDESIQRIDGTRWNEVMQRYDLSRPFVLHYGADEPRRNTRRLIEAWAMTDLKVRQRMQLAIVGMSPATGEDLVKVVNRLGLAASVRLYSRLGDERDLATLLSAADIAAIPAVSAGFPHQVLSAWATRAAVLTSDTGSIAEIAGDAAQLVDPNDAGAVARGLGRLVRDARHRRELIERGTRRLARFNPRDAAERFAQVIEDVTGIRTLRRPPEERNEPLRKAA